MKPKSKLAAILLAIISSAALLSASAAQERPKQPSQSKPSATRSAQKATAEKSATEKSAAEPDEKIEAEPAPPTNEELMRKSLDDLSTQINQLTTEVKRLRHDNERNSDAMQLLLYEERLAKVEEQTQNALDYKLQLDAREADLQRRSRNIQQEVILRGGLRRDEVEAAVRADLQRALDDVHNQQNQYQQRIADLQAQATRLRAKVEALRKKVERTEESNQ